ncbi:Protein phosphatase inhibitor 2 [Orchesella cincta]|uniref:Protein phosphatase inhibitor 2 n=1 Tax=Orchesella cincta TaxID=48709 RepID=A0A1D2N0A0_ORCCI|nr:Protein phosphatase inhibitor 2 [Orchesella cincta]
MSKNSNTVPAKGILRGKSSSAKKENIKDKCALPSSGTPDKQHAHFDEMNILETYHPEEPVQEEPEQPGARIRRSSVDYNKGSVVDPRTLSTQLVGKKLTPLKSSVPVADTSDDDETAKKKAFKAQRAAHYGKEFVKDTQPDS